MAQEISEILASRRVSAYDFLVRIAEGLSVPRGWLGLAHVDVDAKPSSVDVEMSRVEAMPFPADVRLPDPPRVHLWPEQVLLVVVLDVGEGQQVESLEIEVVGGRDRLGQ